ncbi:hypothetical protein QYF61_017897 [Mycteria americana]|uniref:Uncharacterized protein n=1 Tax=Mycteria americana TaxID=33587 RepID=A0AAN7S582_MYCAM|nr:hypothetical protein QYF61_017897 [Mycteria americana]
MVINVPISNRNTMDSRDAGDILISTALESADMGMNQCTDLQRENFMDAFIHIHKYFNIMTENLPSSMEHYVEVCTAETWAIPTDHAAVSGRRETSPLHKAPGIILSHQLPVIPGLQVNHTTFTTWADMTTLPPRTALVPAPATRAALGRSCSHVVGWRKSTRTQALPGSARQRQGSCKESGAAWWSTGRLRHTLSAQTADFTQPWLKSNALPRGVRSRELGAAAFALGCTSPSEPRTSGLARSPLHPSVASACVPVRLPRDLPEDRVLSPQPAAPGQTYRTDWLGLQTSNFEFAALGPPVSWVCSRPTVYNLPVQTPGALQGWRLNHFPGQPVPMLDNPLSEEKFPNIQSKPPLAQLETISSCPITCYLGEETDPHLSTTSFQAKQPQFPQPLLIRLLLQTLHQLHCPSLDSLQHLNVSLVVGGPKLNTVFEVRPHQCRVQGHDHFPTPAGHTVPDTSQDAIGFLGHLGTLLAHIQAAVNQHSQVLFCLAAFQPLFPKPVALHGVAVAQVQDLALGLVEPHTIGPNPSIQPVQVPLQSLPTLQQINTPTQLGVVCKLTEGALDPFVHIIDKDIKQDWPQHRALGNTACDRPPTGVNSIHHHSLGPAIQPVLYPAKSTPVQAMSSQLLQENAVGNRVKGFTEV